MSKQFTAVVKLREEITRAVEESPAVASALLRVHQAGLRLGIYLRISPLEEELDAKTMSPADEEFLRSMRISSDPHNDPLLDAGPPVSGSRKGLWSRLRAAFSAKDRP